MQINRLKAAAAVLAAALAIGLAASPASFADNALIQTINGVYNLRDQLQDVVNKSVKGVADAMKEVVTSSDPPDEKSIDYNLRKYGILDRVAKGNKILHNAQMELFNIDNKLLKLLPKDDPRRAKVFKELTQLPEQNIEVNKKAREFAERRQGFHDLIQDYKKLTGRYPPHNCVTAPGWHLPEGASCGDAPAPDPQGGPTPSSAPSGHGP